MANAGEPAVGGTRGALPQNKGYVELCEGRADCVLVGKVFIINMCKKKKDKNYAVDPDGFWGIVGKVSDQGLRGKEFQISALFPYELLKTGGGGGGG